MNMNKWNLSWLGVYISRYACLTSTKFRSGRALFSRVFAINFTDFRERFFEPLEKIVFTYKDRAVEDFVYTTRHSHIAEIVVQRVLRAPKVRFDFLVPIVSALNIDYMADRIALARVMNARGDLE